MKKAVVIFSGGQDSTTCLLWALNKYDAVEAITFFYEQKHHVEVAAAEQICRKLGVPQMVVDISFLKQLTDSAMVHGGDVTTQTEGKLPPSFVPNRNQIFITLAHSYAQKVGADVLVTGVCQTDYSGYPDCRARFIDAIQDATNLGSSTNIHIDAPLMYLDKMQTFELAAKLGGLDIILNMTHTCYNGSKVPNSWGYGCGECPACELRKNGFEKYATSLQK